MKTKKSNVGVFFARARNKITVNKIFDQNIACILLNLES